MRIINHSANAIIQFYPILSFLCHIVFPACTFTAAASQCIYKYYSGVLLVNFTEYRFTYSALSSLCVICNTLTAGADHSCPSALTDSALCCSRLHLYPCSIVGTCSPGCSAVSATSVDAHSRHIPLLARWPLRTFSTCQQHINT